MMFRFIFLFHDFKLIINQLQTVLSFFSPTGSIISGSSIQKRNARSSNESEINRVDDKIAKIIWTKKVVDHQGWGTKWNVSIQDNTSRIKLLNTGRERAGKRIRHLDTRLFYVKDLVAKKKWKLHVVQRKRW